MQYETLYGTKLASAAENGHFIIRAGKLFDGLSKTSVIDRDIEIENGKIKRIDCRGSFDALDLPIEDYSDSFVMPGLIEAHIHLSGMKTTDAYRRYFEPHDLRVLRAARHAEILLSLGYTSVRDLGGNSVAIGIREAAQLGLTHAPYIKTSIEYLSPTGGHGDWPAIPLEMVKAMRMRSILVDGPEECIRAIRSLVREKADFIKIVVSSGSMGQPYETMKFKDNFSPSELRAMADEAHGQGMIIASHTVGGNGVRRAVEAGIDSLEHCFFNYEKEPELLDLIAERGTFVVPTMSIIHWQGENEEKKGDEKKAQSFYRNVELHGKFVKAAFDAGVTIACGTDETGTRGTGRCPEEYGRWAAAGIPTYGILQGCTSNAARVLGIEKLTGSIQPGKKADILVLKHDPLEDISVLQNKENISLVLQGN